MGRLRSANAVSIGIGFCYIVQWRTRAVGVHIADLIGAALGHFHGATNAIRRVRFHLCAARWDEKHRWSWPIHAVPPEQAHGAPCALARVSSTRTAAPSPRFSPLRFRSKGRQGAGIQRLQRVEPAQRERAQRVAAPCQHHGRGTIKQHVGGKRNRHRSGSASHGDGAVRSVNA